MTEKFQSPTQKQHGNRKIKKKC